MKLAIYGTGGLGAEAFVISQYVNREENKWDEVFFIDDFNFNRQFKGARVRSFEDALADKADFSVVIVVGEPTAREALFQKALAHGLQIATLVHPKTSIPDCALIGRGVVLCEHVTICSDVVIEDNAYIQPLVQISHDCKIGRSAVLSPHAALAGLCVIGEQAYVGMGALVKEKVTIGEKAVVGMGSVVLKDVPQNVVVVGNPARIIRKSDAKKLFG